MSPFKRLAPKLLRIAIWCAMPLVVEFIVFLFSHSTPQFPSSPWRAHRSGLETRVYDVRFLIWTVPDFTDAPDFGPPPTAVDRFLKRMSPENWSIFGSVGCDRDEMIDGVTNDVQNCIDLHPGRQGEMKDGRMVRELQGQLIVTATRNDHARISALLPRLFCYQWLFRHMPYYYLPWIGLTIAWRLASHRYGRAARRHQNGLCVQCGYDLRESPERCPECGEKHDLALNKLKTGLVST